MDYRLPDIYQKYPFSPISTFVFTYILLVAAGFLSTNSGLLSLRFRPVFRKLALKQVYLTIGGAEVEIRSVMCGGTNL